MFDGYENLVLVRYGELHLKGLNRPFFERKLVQNIHASLDGIQHRVTRENGRIYVTQISDSDISHAIERLKHVFGLHSVSVAISVKKDWDSIVSACEYVMENELKQDSNKTFKVFAKRADKKFHLNSEHICREMGHQMLVKFPSLKVDVVNPQIKLSIEIREKAYIYANEIPCAGGLPVGTSGRAMLLLSGGIDSPVAGYMLAKRGVELSAIHYFSHPYTSERAKEKVIELTGLLSAYAGEIRLHIVPFTDIQLAIYQNCPEKETTVLMRRLMMQIAERVAQKDNALALITGEALGQVASQTLESLCVTDDAVSMPVFRPLIGMDKTEITDIARKINTFETSILPYEDCCTVFVPKHPVTKPDVKKLRESEAMFDFSQMIDKAIENTELIIKNNYGGVCR
ncbi:MAG: tRNA 4-thiouridine(8) synthase ThiI [Clostridiales bacterium]|nr:tRNA 4-thiouridine(8) synthase ThiI [Clostridiales bacterium]